MQKDSRPISDYMTPMPFTIDNDETLVKARALMREFNIRHLPVRADFKIVGMLSLQEVESIASHAASDFPKKLVQDAMVQEAYFVQTDTPLDQVVAHMAKQKIGSALVVQASGSLVGIFTDVDALKALAKICQAS